MTNAVKHFKWTAKGKRRIHAKPNWGEIAACRPWLDAELAAVRPDVLVALGATAGQSLFGRDFRVTKQRGQPVETELAPHALATIPSVGDPSFRRKRPRRGARGLRRRLAGRREAAGCDLVGAQVPLREV